MAIINIMISKLSIVIKITKAFYIIVNDTIMPVFNCPASRLYPVQLFYGKL